MTRGFWAVLAVIADRVRGEDPERGDVPGRMMITVMTAALVPAVLIPFREAIVSAVENALTSVTNGGRAGTPPGLQRDPAGVHPAREAAPSQI